MCLWFFVLNKILFVDARHIGLEYIGIFCYMLGHAFERMQVSM